MLLPPWAYSKPWKDLTENEQKQMRQGLLQQEIFNREFEKTSLYAKYVTANNHTTTCLSLIEKAEEILENAEIECEETECNVECAEEEYEEILQKTKEMLENAKKNLEDTKKINENSKKNLKLAHDNLILANENYKKAADILENIESNIPDDYNPTTL